MLRDLAAPVGADTRLADVGDADVEPAIHGVRAHRRQVGGEEGRSAAEGGRCQLPVLVTFFLLVCIDAVKFPTVVPKSRVSNYAELQVDSADERGQSWPLKSRSFEFPRSAQQEPMPPVGRKPGVTYPR
jgi:hypothetical protein